MSSSDGEFKTTDTFAKQLKILELPTHFAAMPDRAISEATVRKYQVTVHPEGNLLHTYPFFDKDGNHVANQGRLRTKDFRWQGEPKRATLFGQQLFPPGSGKAITVSEGACDAMAVFEMTGSRYPSVAVVNAQGAAKQCADNFEYLNSFPEIVLAMDRDEAKQAADGSIHYPGQEAAIAIAGLFPIGKVRILTLQKAKDPNDYLLGGWSKDFIKEWWDAPGYTPSGLKTGSSMWDEIVAPKDYNSIPYPWVGMNEKTYGLRLSEMVVVTADTGVGKTSFIKEIEYGLLMDPSQPSVGFLHLEEPNADTALGLMSIVADKPLHLPDVRKDVSDDELRTYYDSIINSDRVVIWDHFGSNSIHEVLSKIRHMVALGCKYIVLDHLSIVVSDQSGDERKQLDEIATKLKTLCMELNVCIIAVIHQNRAGQIRGTAGVEQLANIVIKLSRDKEADDLGTRNTTKAVIQKNRFCGITGPACYLRYWPESGRLTELEDYVEQGEGFPRKEAPWDTPPAYVPGPN